MNEIENPKRTAPLSRLCQDDQYARAMINLNKFVACQFFSQKFLLDKILMLEKFYATEN